MKGKSKQPMNETEQLISSQGDNDKPCRYPTCKNRIPKDSEFEFCEVCRVVAIRNAVTLMADPIAPAPMERRDSIFHTTICNMRAEEILRAVQYTEYLYLNFCKIVKARQLDLPSTKRNWNTLQGEVDEARSTKKTAKSTKPRTSKRDKLIKLAGSREAAEAIMGDIDEL